MEWLAAITREFPGAGITPWTVERLPAHWWRYYILATQQLIDQQADPKG